MLLHSCTLGSASSFGLQQLSSLLPTNEDDRYIVASIESFTGFLPVSSILPPLIGFGNMAGRCSNSLKFVQSGLKVGFLEQLIIYQAVLFDQVRDARKTKDDALDRGNVLGSGFISCHGIRKVVVLLIC